MATYTRYAKPTIIYAGYDPGSGEATLSTLPAADVANQQDKITTIPSMIADGIASKILGRGNVDATLGQVLHEGEYVLTYNDNEYFLGDLTREGKNATSAIGDQNRYWSSHSLLLLLSLACLLTSDQSIELRLVTALPVSLYTPENRKKVKKALEGYYRFSFATKGKDYRDREIFVKVGYVAMEGQGILVHSGEVEGDQAVFDIGERTFDLIVADGQKVLTGLCHGNEELGVSLLVDDLQELAREHKHTLKPEKAHAILHAYAHNEALPFLSWINEKDLESFIYQSIHKAGRALTSFISSHLTSDGESVAASFDRVYLAGGGAYYFSEIIQALIDDQDKVIVVEDSELDNARGYAELATALQTRKSDIWER